MSRMATTESGLPELEADMKPAMLPENFLPDFWHNAARPLLAGRSPLA